MERKIILKNTETGQELTLPVTPSRYPMAAGRAVEVLDMAQTGQVALPGLQTLMGEAIEGFFPAKLYPFCAPGAVADPRYYIDLLTQWSREAQVCRYIVAGTGINAPVLLEPLEYGEEDGSNDVTYRLPLREYRYLEEARVEQTGNSARPTEGAAGTQAAQRYTVEAGDCLWTICRKIYGEGALAYKLATANGIRNPNLIYPGQVLELPERSALDGYGETRGVSAGTAASSGRGGGQSAGSGLPTAEELRQEQLAIRKTLGLGGR